MPVSGDDIVNEILRNLNASLEPLHRTVLAPSIYRVYLCRSDLARLEGVLGQIRQEAWSALDEEMEKLNRPVRLIGLVRRLLGLREKRYGRAENSEWEVDFFEDPDGELQSGDLTIHSELTPLKPLALKPGDLTKVVTTCLIGGQRTVVHAPLRRVEPPTVPGVHARIRFIDDDGPHVFEMSQAAVLVGRGGGEKDVDLRLHTNTDVSREHARIRRDAQGGYLIQDLSRNGIMVDGLPIPPGVEKPLSSRASISLGGAICLEFERVTTK